MARRGWNPQEKIYAAYRGDEYIGEGTIAEIADMAGVSCARGGVELRAVHGKEAHGERRRRMRHGGQRSRRFMRREMARARQKRLIALGREVERRKRNGKHEDLADKDDA